MYIRLKTSKKAKHPTVQIVEGYREGNKVKQKTIASLGVVKGPEDKRRLIQLAESLIRRLDKFELSSAELTKVNIESLKHQETVYNGNRTIAERLLEIAGFSKIIENTQGRQSYSILDIVSLIVANRLHVPSSKHRIFERQNDYAYQEIKLQHLYRAMDKILPLKDELLKQAFDVATDGSASIECMFFDVTTLYFESVKADSKDDEEGIRDFGWSKDCKFKEVQIVLALVVNKEGVPLAYEAFRGNTAETKTLIPVLKKLRQDFKINRVTIVCDRAMASETNVDAVRSEGFSFILACKLRKLSKKININDLSEFSEIPGQMHVEESERVLIRTLKHPTYENCHLVVSYCPKRARKDKRERERIIERLKTTLRGKGDESVKKLVSNSGYKRYINFKKGADFSLDEKKIREDEEWDGFHGVSVSDDAEVSFLDALSLYRGLWRVEEAFRVEKCAIKARPIFHWTPNRIRAHVLLCFLALYVERYLEWLLRQAGTPLTLDRIRYAMSQMHSIYFQDTVTGKKGIMESSISEDGKAIYKVLGLALESGTAVV
jgi:transposase